MNFVFLVLPTAVFILSFYTEGPVGLTLIPMACLGFLHSLFILKMSPDREAKRNAAYYILGVLLVTLVYGVMAYTYLRSQQSPWFQ